MDLMKELRLVEIAENYWEAELDGDKEAMKHWKDKMDEENSEGKSDK